MALPLPIPDRLRAGPAPAALGTALLLGPPAGTQPRCAHLQPVGGDGRSPVGARQVGGNDPATLGLSHRIGVQGCRR
ncbi:MAG: hypothetical protein VKI81_10065 [Synechococcaceae cyanobacterium]|nr:hypothetical protein [Synechococcaceae cyanobacterium]